MVSKGITLYPIGTLAKEDWLTSPNGRYQLILQPDGNLVLYDLQNGHQPIWASDTNDESANAAVLQDDGNFVLYGLPDPVWATGTDGQGPCSLTLRDDGTLVIAPIPASVWTSQ
jgi:hypothetical protein